MNKCAKQQDAPARLLELGGLGSDDSLRAGFVADAMRAFADLLFGHRELSTINGKQLGALAKIIADDAERVAERQLLDEIRRQDASRGC